MPTERDLSPSAPMMAEEAQVLLERNAKLESLTECIPGGLHQCRADEAFTLLSVSRSFLSLVGYTALELETCFQNSFAAMIYSEDLPGVRAELKRQMAVGNTAALEYRLCRRDGALLWITDLCKLVTAPDGGQTYFCILTDATQKKIQQDELRLTLERHQVIMDQTTDIIFEWNILSDTLTFSSNWRRKFGYEPISDDISGRIPLSANIHPEDMRNFVHIMEAVASGVPYCETEFRIRDSTDHFVWCRIRATTQFDRDGRPVKAVGVILDISTDKQERQALLELARRDALTGLYNKAAVQSLTEQHLVTREGSGVQAMLILDVDNFKAVNDVFGHLCGDSLLADIAAVLRTGFRASDLVGRIGGDEFLVYLPEVSGLEAVRGRAEHLLEALAAIAPAPGAAPISCSIGAALADHGTTDYRTLYHQADQALYHRKREGKGGLTFYAHDMEDAMVLDGLANSAIGSAIDSDVNAVDEQLAQYAFRMLYHTVEPRSAINQILEIVGRAYDVSRVYIFESSADGLRCSNTFEWCNAGVASEQEHLQELSYQEDLGGYQDNFDHSGIFHCQDVSKLGPDLVGVLSPQGIRSLLQCAILDNGEFRGFVGFDDCQESRNWTKAQMDSLNLIANVLSTFLVKLRLKERLAELECRGA